MPRRNIKQMVSPHVMIPIWVGMACLILGGTYQTIRHLNNDEDNLRGWNAYYRAERVALNDQIVKLGREKGELLLELSKANLKISQQSAKTARQEPLRVRSVSVSSRAPIPFIQPTTVRTVRSSSCMGNMGWPCP
jgi:cell division protein FtsB